MPSDFEFKVGDKVRRKREFQDVGIWKFGDMIYTVISCQAQSGTIKLAENPQPRIADWFELVSREKDYGPGPHLAADAVVVCRYRILIIRRKDGTFALPGGFVNPGETTREAARRECLEETGLDLRKYMILEKEDLGRGFLFDAPRRDPRNHIVTVAHHFPVSVPPNETSLPTVKAADDASYASWFRLNELHSYCSRFFADHYNIIQKVLYDV